MNSLDGSKINCDKIFFIIILSFVLIFITFNFAVAEVIETDFAYKVRVNYDHTVEKFDLDDYDSIYDQDGIYIADSVCVYDGYVDTDYKAVLLDKKNKSIGEYEIGNFYSYIVSDPVIENKKNEKGTYGFCIPFNTKGKKINIIKKESDKVVLSIDLSDFEGKEYIRDSDDLNIYDKAGYENNEILETKKETPNTLVIILIILFQVALAGVLIYLYFKSRKE